MINDLKAYDRQIRQDLSVSSELRGIPLQFKTTWGLFSPKAIDQGSQMLIDYLDIQPSDNCLDLGCGYGVLGLTMAQLAPEGQTLLVDKDFVAVEYAKTNSSLNRINNAACQLSNGFDQIDKQEFDIIVSNVPAKVSKELLYIFLIDALRYLKPGGSFYIVTITGLRQFFKRGFQEVFGHYEKLKQGKIYTVARGIKQK